MGVPLDPVVNHNVSLLKLSSSSSSSSSPALIISNPSFCNGKLKILETNEPSVSCGLLGKRRWPSDITTASRIGSMGGLVTCQRFHQNPSKWLRNWPVETCFLVQVQHFSYLPLKYRIFPIMSQGLVFCGFRIVVPFGILGVQVSDWSLGF